jgi:transcription antitermination factor NusG
MTDSGSKTKTTSKALQKNWYAIYTRSKAEKKVLIELEFLDIECYLPLITRYRQWSDRKKKVEEPLFRSYIFVHIHESLLYTVRNVPNVARFVSFEGKPTIVPEEQIHAIRYYLDEQDDPEDIDHSLIQEGQLVRIKQGQMEGLIGRMIHYRNKYRLMVQIEAVEQIISLNIPRSKVEPIKQA